MHRRRSLVLSVLVFLAGIAGCSGEIVSLAPGDGSHDPGARDGGGGPPFGDGGAPPCADGQHLQGGTCVANEVTCANEFPCPMGLTCAGGRCISLPGPCATHDDCPTGDVCVMGKCEPAGCKNGCKSDAECGAGKLCVACQCITIDQCKMPTADLAGPPWSAHQVLHLDEALGGFAKTIIGVLKDLRDGIEGCPKGSGNNCWAFQILAGFLPDWAKTLVVAVGNFGDILDNHQFIVDSEMTFTKNGKPSGYHGKDRWLMLSFSYHNMKVMKAPKDVPQIGKDVAPEFDSSAVCGVLYVDKHKVEGVLSGILKWILDTVVELGTCNGKGPCYHSLGDAIDGAIDCAKISANPLDPARLICQGFKQGLKAKIEQAINSWLLSYSLMTLKGTATIPPSGKSLDNGHWDGTLGDGLGLFKNFDGEWSAKR